MKADATCVSQCFRNDLKTVIRTHVSKAGLVLKTMKYYENLVVQK